MDNNNNNNNDKLFFLIWRNIYINKIIFQEIRIFQNLYQYTKILKIINNDQFDNINIPYSNYIQYLNLSNIDNDKFQFQFNKLPSIYINHLYLPNNFNSNLKPNEINDNLPFLKVLIFGKQFNNSSINQDNILPNTLEILEMGFEFNKPLLKLPINLKSLKLSDQWDLEISSPNDNNNNLDLSNLLNLEYLEFGNKFNKKLNLNKFNNYLKILKFGNSFNQEISNDSNDNDCTNLEIIKFGNNFNKEIGINVLPKSLKEIYFGNLFNKSIKVGVLSECKNLEIISFGRSFDGKLEIGSFPVNSVKYIKFDNNFNQKLYNGILPNSLTRLDLMLDYSIEDILEIDSLPRNGKLTELNLSNYFNHQLLPGMLPNSIKSIKLGNHYKKGIPENTLPSDLEMIIISSSNIPINQINKMFKNTLSLKRLSILSRDANNDIYEIGIFPNSIEYLSICGPIEIGLLPNQLIELVYYDKTPNQPIPINCLPTSLKKLSLLGKFNQPIEKGLLPNSIQELEIGSLFNQTITNYQHTDSFPKSLLKLTLNSIGGNTLNSNCFPIGLKELYLKSLDNITTIDLTDLKSLIKLSIIYDNFFLPHEFFPKISLPDNLEEFQIVGHFSKPSMTNNYQEQETNEELDQFDVFKNFNGKNLKTIEWNTNVRINKLPSSVTHLKFGSNYQAHRYFKKDLIPSSVTNLEFIGFSPSEITFPNSTTSLSIYSSTIKFFSFSPPPQITDLVLSYNEYFISTIPNNLDLSSVKLKFKYFIQDDMDFY